MNMLLKEIKIAGLTLRNRTLFPPISTNFAAEDGHLTEKFIAHYARRARGGVALVIVENSCIDYPDGKKGAFEPRIDSYDFIDDWRRLVTAVHQYDALISVELAQPGYKEKNVALLSHDKIEEIVDKYAIATKIAADAGFDMVEVQGAHGLLVNQFLSPLTNHREDAWGEPTRFAEAIRNAIASKCGADFPVTIRLAVDDFKAGGIDLALGKKFAERLADVGYAMIQADIGIGTKMKRLEPMAYSEGWRSYLAEGIKPLSVPVAAVGLIRSPEVAEQILQNKADIVALGRTLIADPDWVHKVADGQTHLIRKCIGCSECIKARHDEDVAIRCGVNANVGNEEDIEEAKDKKVVAIVGCGPAGLEAARVASERGHSVHLFCEQFGGQLNIAAVPPGKEKIKWLTNFYAETLKEHSNIKIYDGEFTKDDVMKVGPDYVIMATGTKPIVPFPVVENMVYIYDDILSGTTKLNRKNIAVIGGGLVGCETANFLAENNSVTVVEMLPDIAIGMETLSKKHLVEELKDKNVKILLKRKVIDIQNGMLIVENEDTRVKETIFCDAIVIAVGGRPYVPFTIDGVQSYIIGDAQKVRKIVDAVRDGYDTARGL